MHHTGGLENWRSIFKKDMVRYDRNNILFITDEYKKILPGQFCINVIFVLGGTYLLKYLYFSALNDASKNNRDFFSNGTYSEQF